jgi:hypothetical protein
VLKKFEIKYGWKAFEIKINFPYRNVSGFKMEFELKFREVFMGRTQLEIHWKFLQLWNSVKFG